MLRRVFVGRRAIPAPLAPAFAVFRDQAERVENARRALLGCLPVGRVNPAPVAVGLDLLHDEISAVASELGAWRTPEIEQHWTACRDAVREAVMAIPEARQVATETAELEELLDAVSEVVAPLDAWHDAERAWLRLRMRPYGWCVR